MKKPTNQTPTLVSQEMANVLETMKPRLKSSVVAKLSGLSRRAITGHAANDNILGAVKHGGLWTFDHDLALLWVNEGSKCQTTKKKPKAA